MRQKKLAVKKRIFRHMLKHTLFNDSKDHFSVDDLCEAIDFPRATGYRWAKDLKTEIRQKCD